MIYNGGVGPLCDITEGPFLKGIVLISCPTTPTLWEIAFFLIWEEKTALQLCNFSSSSPPPSELSHHREADHSGRTVWLIAAKGPLPAHDAHTDRRPSPQ